MAKVKCILLLLIALAGCQANEPTATAIPATTPELPAGFDVQGHRGARGLKPENTLPAFETALDLGVTTLELDLHLTADGVVVIWHDDRITKDKCGLAEGGSADAPNPDDLAAASDALMISRLTFAQIQSYRCDRNPDAGAFPAQNNEPTALAGDTYHVASLEELFQFVDEYSQSDLKSETQRANASAVMFNMETKRKANEPEVINDGFDGQNPGPFEMEILRLLETYAVKDRSVVQSFDYRSLWAIRSVDDTIRLAALTSRGKADIAEFAQNGADIWSPNYNMLTAELVKTAHQNNMQVIPWTVNEPAAMLDLIAMGVDGIISDRPDILLDLQIEK